MSNPKQNELAARTATEWWLARMQPHDQTRWAGTMYDVILARLTKYGICQITASTSPQGIKILPNKAEGEFELVCRGFLPEYAHTIIFPDSILPKEGYGNWTAAISIPLVKEE